MTEEYLKQFLDMRYGHLPRTVREQIEAAYCASAKRDPEVLLIDRGVSVQTDITSTKYKEALWNR